MKQDDLEKKLFQENASKMPDPKLGLIDKIAYWVIGLFVIGFLIWKFGIPALGIAGMVIDWIASILNFLFSWKVAVFLLLLFIAITLNDIRQILSAILNKLYDDRL